MKTHDDDKTSFSLICLVSAYIYLKEKYERLVIDVTQKRDDVEDILKELKTLDRYIHLPNKTKFIEESYDFIYNKTIAGSLDEEDFLNIVREKATEFARDDKKYIMECLLRVVLKDHNISDNERESFWQIANAIGISDSVKDILGRGTQKKPNLVMIAIGGIATIAIISLLIFIRIREPPVFEPWQRDIVFSEIFFNRMIIYQNKFSVKNDHMRKMAVYYINGSAEISFKPSQLTLNQTRDSLTLIHDGAMPFQLKMHFEQPLEVDKIDPQPISAEEARTIGACVGVVSGFGGAVLGKMAGDLISKLIPLPYKLFVPLGGAVTGGLGAGAMGYFVTSEALEGWTLSKSITPGETREITEAAKELIKSALLAETELGNIFKDKFEAFIKEKYDLHGMKININYKSE